MNYHDVTTAVAGLGEEVALIHHKTGPAHEYFAEIEYCSFDEDSGRGFVYLFWVDRRTLASYSETLTRVDVGRLLAIQGSGILLSDCNVAFLGDDWRERLNDRSVFPGPGDGLAAE